MIPGRKFTPEDILSILWKRKWIILLPFVAATIGAWVYARRLPDMYQSDTLILVVPQRVPESYVRSTVTTRIEDRLQSISQQILSRTRLERIIRDFNLYAEQRRNGIMEDIIEMMRRDINVQIVKGDAFRVSFVGTDPRSVMKVTERLASLFIEENLRDREVLAEGTNQFLEAQLEDARRRLVEHEKKLEEYRRRFSGELPTQVESNLQVLQNTQLQVQSLLESMSRDRDRRTAAERALADLTAPDAAAKMPSVQPAGGERTLTPLEQLEVARRLLRNMETRLKPEHPDVIQTKRAIERLEQKVKADETERQNASGPNVPLTAAEIARSNRIKELQAEIENLNKQIEAKVAEEKRLRTVIAAYTARVEAAPTRESELIELTRDYTTLQGSYQSLLGKREESKIAANLERRQIGEQFKMLDAARLPERPFSPDRRRINMMGALIGLALGIGLTALLEYRDNSLKTDEDVANVLQLPVLAIIPLMLTVEEQHHRRQRTLLVSGIAAVVIVLSAAAVAAWRFKLFIG